jgi:hypothetical protein
MSAIELADRPVSPAQPLVGDFVDLARVLQPLPARRMDGRDDEGHPRHDLRLGLGIVHRQKLRRGIGSRQVEQAARHLVSTCPSISRSAPCRWD